MNCLLIACLNIETVKYFHNGQYDYEKCDLILQQQEKAGIKVHFFSSFFQFGQKAIIGIGLIFLTWKSGNAVLTKTMTVGDFVLINSYLLQFAAPLSGFGYIARQVKKGLADMGDIIALLAVDPEIKDAADASIIDGCKAEISFDGVSFGYTQEREILKIFHLPYLLAKQSQLSGLLVRENQRLQNCYFVFMMLLMVQFCLTIRIYAQ